MKGCDVATTKRFKGEEGESVSGRDVDLAAPDIMTPLF